eukprot:UN27725
MKELNDTVDAVICYQKMYRTDEKELNKHFKTLCRCTNESEAVETIRLIWDIWLNHSAEDVNTLFKEGLTEFNNGNIDMALDKFNQVVKLDCTYAEAWNRRSLCNLKRGFIDEALYDIQR